MNTFNNLRKKYYERKNIYISAVLCLSVICVEHYKLNCHQRNNTTNRTCIIYFKKIRKMHNSELQIFLRPLQFISHTETELCIHFKIKVLITETVLLDFLL